MKYYPALYLFFVGLTGCELPVYCDPGPESFLAVIYTREGVDYLEDKADDPLEL